MKTRRMLAVCVNPRIPRVTALVANERGEGLASREWLLDESVGLLVHCSCGQEECRLRHQEIMQRRPARSKDSSNPRSRIWPRNSTVRTSLMAPEIQTFLTISRPSGSGALGWMRKPSAWPGRPGWQEAARSGRRRKTPITESEERCKREKEAPKPGA